MEVWWMMNAMRSEWSECNINVMDGVCGEWWIDDVSNVRDLNRWYGGHVVNEMVENPPMNKEVNVIDVMDWRKVDEEYIEMDMYSEDVDEDDIHVIWDR